MGYFNWLHGKWPSGTVESLPDVNEDGTTSVPGLRVVGDLTGIPLLKFAADTGAKAVQAVLAEPDFAGRRGKTTGVLDLAIVGGGIAGVAAALEAKKAGLDFALFESTQPFATIANFPKAKPIFTYPASMKPAGELALTADVKEALLAELEQQRVSAGIEARVAHVSHIERRGDELIVQSVVDGVKTEVRALRVIVAIGRSGNYRSLGVPGEELDKVSNRLHDPKDYGGKDVLVVGGGDSAVEAAIALAEAGARVTLSHRKPAFARPKPENVARLDALKAGSGSAPKLTLLMASQVRQIRDTEVVLKVSGGTDETLPNDAVFTMIGREAPLDFFRRSGVPIRGEWRAPTWVGFLSFVAFCTFIYIWKSGGELSKLFEHNHWFPYWVPGAVAHLGTDPATVFGTLRISLGQPAFYYTLAYTIAIVGFGIARIRRRKTPYVMAQTLSLMSVQIIPLFLLPYLVLPWLGHNGAFDHGFWKTFADNLFPAVSWDAQGREYWRAFGFILAWPLFIWNFFTSQPMAWWLVIGCVQTFVIIPLIVWRWGKGAYCGFICSCGALAETMGDTQRQKMPHGPIWNRLNMVGQVILGIVFALFAMRIISWTWPRSGVGRQLGTLFYTALNDISVLGVRLDYYHVVDLFLAGIVGVGFYFWASGRVWCRFACPLAALMHIYARFTSFRIFADKKKCISCNVCTSVCHQGIDVMAFANKGAPMQDPECVRCSACVQSCPTGVLTFGRVGADGAPIYDALAASPVQMREGAGKKRLPIAA